MRKDSCDGSRPKKLRNISAASCKNHEFSFIQKNQIYFHKISKFTSIHIHESDFCIKSETEVTYDGTAWLQYTPSIVPAHFGTHDALFLEARVEHVHTEHFAPLQNHKESNFLKKGYPIIQHHTKENTLRNIKHTGIQIHTGIPYLLLISRFLMVFHENVFIHVHTVKYIYVQYTKNIFNTIFNFTVLRVFSLL